jgi:hypothetical protein
VAQKDNPVDVGDEPQVRTRKKKVDIRRERELHDIRENLKTTSGRGFLWRLLSECGIFQSTSYADETPMAIKSGRRDIGIWMLSEIEQADKDGFIKLIRENQQRDINGL